MVSELRREARGPRAHDAKRAAHLCRRQADDTARRNRGAEGPGRRRLVKAALVMLAAQYHADPDRGLGPEQEGVAQCSGTCITILRERKRRRQDRHGGMAHMAKCVSS